MIGLAARRAARAAVVLWVAISIVFVLALGAGDPAVATLGPRASAAQLQAYRHRHGLDRPLWAQYATYMGGLMHGDLGRSMRDQQPVAQVIAVRLPRTMLLGALALGFELALGIALGTLAALRRNSMTDAVLMGISFLGISAPTFLTGLLFLQVVAFRLGWFPVGGYGVDPMDHLRHAILPSFTLAIVGAATYARMMRSELIETLRHDYVRTARAKGLGPRAVLRHAMRSALIPIVTMVGLSMPILVSGAVVTETVYGWPGIGRLAFEAISAGDVPLVMGIVLVAALAVQAGNLSADLAVAWLDPRVRPQR